MRYWLDTEFIEDGKTIQLLSIGIVAEDGRELYLETQAAHDYKAFGTCQNEWVKENVIPHLGQTDFGCTREDIRANLLAFCDPDQHGKPEFWGYYADYDWVVLCQLFGTMMDLPKGWPMFCMDIKQWAVMLDNPKLPEQSTTEHHALADARWNKEAWDFLAEVQP